MQSPPERRTGWLSGRWPLIAILAVQAVLTARLIWSNTAFQDEGLYLWAGHLETAHLLHGEAIPTFATYFSGAPTVYPPLGALADSLGGLAGARLLSLCFMLGATALLWGMTARLFGRRAALFAAAFFAVLGPTQFVGALATYDAMALFLMALAAWCAVRGRYRQDAAGWMVLAGTVLVLANVTAYATILFDPVVVLLAIMAARPEPGFRRALTRGAMIVVHVIVLVAILDAITGSSYRTGLAVTIFSRAAGDNSAASVLADSWAWAGVLAILALVGVGMSWTPRFRFLGRPTLPVLAGAILLAPLEQARIHTLISLDKHVDIGAWFAAAAAGYAISRLTRGEAPRAVVAGACVLLLAAIYLGAAQSSGMYVWPGSANLIAKLRPLTAHGGHFLAETASVPEYYLPQTSWRQWSSTFSITTQKGRVQNEKGSLAPYTDAISQKYFKVIVLDFRNTAALDAGIEHDMIVSHAYRLVAKVPFGAGVTGDYQIWELSPAGAAG